MSTYKIGNQVAPDQINEILEKLSNLPAVGNILKDGGVSESEATNLYNQIGVDQLVMASPLITPDEAALLKQHISKTFPKLDLDSGSLRRSALRFDTFDSLAAPRGPIKMDPRSTIEGFDGVIELVEANQFTFVGENHLVDDEKLFAEMADDLRKLGVDTFAVELETNFQEPLELYLKTGEVSGNMAALIRAFPDLMALIRVASDAGMKIHCFDQPFDQQNRDKPEEREQFIASNLMNLNGKALVWTGSAHAAIDRNPYNSARAILEDKGVSTAGIRLESRTGDEVLKAMGVNDYTIQTALNAYFPDSSPSEVIGLQTSAVSGMMFADSTHPNPMSRLSYTVAFDLILFLPESYSKQSVHLTP